jgi:hypothetical protein
MQMIEQEIVAAPAPTATTASSSDGVSPARPSTG